MLKLKPSNLGTILISICAILAQTTSSYADGLPEGRRITFSGETLQCYDLEGFKSLVLMDTALENITVENQLLLAQSLNLQDKISHLEEIQSVQVAQIKLFSDENERLYTMWKEENRKRHLAESKPSFNFIPWALAGVFAASTATLLVVVAVD